MKNDSTKALRKLLISFVIILGAVKFILIPLQEQLKGEKELMKTEVEKIVRLKKMLSEVVQKENTGDFEGIHIKIPYFVYNSSEDALQLQLKLLSELLGQLEKNGLELQSFDLLPLTYGKTLTEISLGLRFRGKTKKVLDFFKELEKREQPLLIRECLISESGRHLSVTLVLSILKSEI